MARKSRPWRVEQAGVDGFHETTSEDKAYTKVREMAREGADGLITVWQWEPAYNRWARYEDLNPIALRAQMEWEGRRG